MVRQTWALAVASVLFLSGCDTRRTTTAPADQGALRGGTASAIEVGDVFYKPDSLIVFSKPTGVTVRWVWTGTELHDVSFETDTLRSPTQRTGTYSRTFEVPGTYTYFCSVHGLGAQRGVVVVK